VSRLLVRFAKRKTPWEECDPEQIRESEFKDRNGEGYDLRPSVYDIAPSEVVRTFAEHAAAAPIDPPGSALAIDLHGVPFAIGSEPGKPTFAFTCAQHRELVLASKEDVDQVIASALANGANGRIPVPKADVYAYARGRLSANDEEWRTVVESTDAKEWLLKLDKKLKAAK
jgi:hypothetical protein